MVEMSDILVKLIKRTDEGGVPWKRTVDEDSFRSQLREFFSNAFVFIWWTTFVLSYQYWTKKEGK